MRIFDIQDGIWIKLRLSKLTCPYCGYEVPGGSEIDVQATDVLKYGEGNTIKRLFAAPTSSCRCDRGKNFFLADREFIPDRRNS